ncbi:MAG: type II secretion system protein [Kiritimatiellia bacterium]
MKKAFTLVELLVVIGIIGLLTSVLLVTFGRGTESARATKCLTGMRNLANGVTARAMDAGYYPLAGSVERYGIDESQGIQNAKECYDEVPGWISWYSRAAYRSKPTSHISSSSWFISCYDQDKDARLYCLTNGTLWKYISKNADVYVCPSHQRAMSAELKPAWSYAMNARFGYDDTYGSGSKAQNYYGVRFGSLARADRTLLFAEIPWAKNLTDPDPQFSTSAGTDFDCTLHYKDRDKELIGFDHRDGRRWVAHVVFADGHAEKLYQPERGLDAEKVWELTDWLCRGKDVSFNGERYEELK